MNLRVAVAGAGYGAEVLAPLLAAQPGVRVVAIAGRDPVRTSARASALGCASLSLAGLDSCDADAIAVALPPAIQAGMLPALIASGRPLLLEKPLGADPSSLPFMDWHPACAVDYGYAELDCLRAMVQAVSTGRIGRPRRAMVRWLLESRANRDRQWGWRMDAAAGGGVLGQLGSHDLHLLRRTFGAPDRMHAVLSRSVATALAPPGGKPAEDHVAIDGAWGGVPIQMAFGNACPGLLEHRWEIIGEDASLVAENRTLAFCGGFCLKLAARGWTSETLVQERPEGNERAWASRRSVHAWIAAIRGIGRPACTLSEALAVESDIATIRAA